uniref:Sodium-neurotransmitter symporter n=1 Tax=Glossina morsitans morsitans TaxID=37546 RepID=A0A1B0GCH5_GLOMM
MYKCGPRKLLHSRSIDSVTTMKNVVIGLQKENSYYHALAMQLVWVIYGDFHTYVIEAVAIIMGQFSSIGCIGVFRMAPLFKGAGYAIVVINIICTIYYSVIIAYPLMFLKHIIFQAKLPWDSCDNSWNTDHCIDVHQVMHHNFTEREDLRTPADEFFHFEILRISKGIEELGDIVWPLFWSLAMAWALVYICIINGIKTVGVGKVVYFTATFPYLILFVLFVRGITLPGAAKGIIFYIKPEWLRLLDLKVWADAAVQIFFSLGPGWGGIVNMASYNSFRNNAKGDAILIPIVNCSTSIFAGFVVFSVLGYLSEQTGIPVATVATSGPGLAFVIYPQAIAMLPLSRIWATLFFLMLFLLGLDTVFVQIEAIISSVLDELPAVRPYKYLVTLISCLAMFSFSIILFIFFTTIIFIRTVRYNNVIYPSWAVAVGWLSCALSLICIPLHMLKKVFFSSGKAKDNFCNALKADFWLPVEEEERSAYEDFKRYQQDTNL